MDRDKKFSERFRYLSAVLSADFYDSDASSDEETARGLLCDGSSPHLKHRIDSIRYLVEDCRAALPELDEFWRVLGNEAGKNFSSAEEAGAWLRRITQIWEDWLVEQEKAAKK